MEAKRSLLGRVRKIFADVDPRNLKGSQRFGLTARVVEVGFVVGGIATFIARPDFGGLLVGAALAGAGVMSFITSPYRLRGGSANNG